MTKVEEPCPAQTPQVKVLSLTPILDQGDTATIQERRPTPHPNGLA
ncbi:hypothetical protein ACFWDQ_01520 [Streptomyces sp. NPDC060053]